MGVFYPLDFFSYFCKGKKFRSSSDYPPNEIYDFAQSIPLNKHHITVDNSYILFVDRREEDAVYYQSFFYGAHL